MKDSRAVFWTIGYEGADLDDFLATLRCVGVRLVIDVRELPISRRKGFGKAVLSARLGENGIGYVHLKGLGDPKEGRDAARAGDMERFRAIFNRHMKSAAAQTDLQRAEKLVEEGGVCLLCYERDHDKCHRTLVATQISDRIPSRIVHLGVKTGLGKFRAEAAE
jgi:uncharacterized protein (DUF488 family)